MRVELEGRRERRAGRARTSPGAPQRDDEDARGLHLERRLRPMDGDSCSVA